MISEVDYSSEVLLYVPDSKQLLLIKNVTVLLSWWYKHCGLQECANLWRMLLGHHFQEQFITCILEVKT